VTEFEFRCKVHGRFTNHSRGPEGMCPQCGAISPRRWDSVQIRTTVSGGGYEGWNPVVGQYVANRREFDNVLAQGIDRESRRLGMDVKVEQVDARDTDALNDLHGMSSSDREADLDPQRKALHDQGVK